MVSEYLHRLVNSISPFPLSTKADWATWGWNSCRHLVVITLVSRHQQTNVRIELKEMEGGVKATSFLCLLGIGIGVGSVLIYKLCSRFFLPSLGTSSKKKTSCTAPGDTVPGDKTGPETPDSGITMGNSVTGTPEAGSPDGPTTVLFTAPDDVRLPERFEQSPSQARPSFVIGQSADDSFTSEVSGQVQDGGQVRLRRKPGDGSRLGQDDACKSNRDSAISCGSNDLDPKCWSPSSDLGFISGNGHPRQADGTESIGGYSLIPNYSPTSLYDRSQRALNDLQVRVIPSTPVVDDATTPTAESEKKPGCDPLLPGDYANLRQNRHSTPQDEKTFRLERSLSMRDQLMTQSDYSIDEDDVFLRRQPFSFCSDISASSDFSNRDYLCSRYSVDLGENLSGMMTPDSEVFETGQLGRRTCTNMDQIQNELKELRKEISEMNLRVGLLNSKEDVNSTDDNSNMADVSTSLLVKRRRRTRKRTRSRSRSISEDRESCDFSDISNREYRNSYHYLGEFMWDYQSDLGTCIPGQNFVARRPVVGDVLSDSSEGSGSVSPSLEHVRKYLESTGSPFKSMHNTSQQNWTGQVSDMYIEDDVIDLGNRKTLEEAKSKMTSPSKRSSPLDGSPRENSSPVCAVTPCVYTTSNNNNNNVDLKDSLSNTEHAHRTTVRSAHVSPQRVSRLRDLSHTDTKSSPGNPRWEVKNIGQRINVYEYAEKEWHGGTEHAQIIKKGYHKIPGLLNLASLRIVRGDNYCAVRATLYQVLVNNIPLFRTPGSIQGILQKLAVFRDHRYPFLQSWNFANRLPYSKDQVYEKAVECVNCLYEQLEAMCLLDSYAARERHLLALFNLHPDVDLLLMEAVKILLMISALHLYESQKEGKPVPVFVWLLFARSSSETPEALFRNHLNVIGDSGGLEQIELFLLGHTLGVKLEVVRPSQFGKEDFIAHYPDEGVDNYPKVFLVAEDDRHYNVVVP